MVKKPGILTKEEKEIIKKAKELYSLERALAIVSAKTETLKEELRSFVNNNFDEIDKKDRKIWQRGIVEVILTPTPHYEINKEAFIAKVGLEKAAKYMDISRQRVLGGIKAKELALTEEDLEEIEKTAFGQEKVKVKLLDQQTQDLKKFFEK